jgi:selT/selW/selH-like putative selenoprotein
LAAAIKKAVGADPKLIPSGGGVFEIVADGQLVFSKKSAGRFPEDQEVLSALRKLS